MFPLCGVTLSDDQRRRYAAMFQQSLGPLKAAAAEADDKDPRLLARWFNLETGALLALCQQGPTYLRKLAVAIACEVGIDRSVIRQRQLERIVITRKRQARASLTPASKRRTA